jgi:hypothetical protein
MTGGDWTVVRAHVSPPDAAPEPHLYAVHAKQWRRPRDEPTSAQRRRRVLTDAFVPAGLISHVPVTGRLQRWHADAVLVGSASLSLGIAAGALERVRGSGAFGPAAGPASAELAIGRQQCADLDLAVMNAWNRLGTAAGAYECASASERDGCLRSLAETMREAASVAQLVTASAYELCLGSDDVTARQDMTRFMAGIAPALQNGRLAGEFLDITMLVHPKYCAL